MLRRLRQWRQLPPHERYVLLLLMTLQPVLSILLRVFGYRRTLAREEALGGQEQKPGRPATATEIEDAERLAQLASIAGARGPVVTSCLRQAIAVYGLLRRRGLRPHIRFGVDRLGANPDMHAWVELEGVPLAQPNLRHRVLAPTTMIADTSQ